MSKTPPPTLHLPSTEAYNRWAPTYDTDGNILPALDTHALSTALFPRLLHDLLPFSCSQGRNGDECQALRIIDLGCGTGRVMLGLLAFLQRASCDDGDDAIDLFTTPGPERSHDRGGGGPTPREVHITGLDASKGMLNVARGRLKGMERIEVVGRRHDNNNPPHQISVAVKIAFRGYEILSPPPNIEDLPVAAAASTVEAETGAGEGGKVKEGDVLICSLVIEHLPSLETFFRNVVTRGLLKPGGLLLLTNMHPDMARGAAAAGEASSRIGPAEAALHVDADVDTVSVARVGAPPNASGAGFTDTVTGRKIRVAESYAHSIEDVVAAAERAGFEVIDGVEERGVEQWMIDQRIVDARRGKKWRAGGVKCWFGMVLRLVRGLEE